MPEADFRALVDGAVADEIPVTDRGFAYGDGVFRTVRVEAGRPWLWRDHLKVLRRDCGRLGLPWAADLDVRLTQEVEALAGVQSGVLRLVITRGSGPRGDRPPSQPRVRRLLVFFPGPVADTDPRPRTLRLCRVRLPHLPELAGVKHLSRLPQVLARSEWPGPVPEEGLLADAEGALICGTMSNLFVSDGRRILTPVLDRCGVAGVVRGRILAGRVPGQDALAMPVMEARIDLERLLAAREVFVTNAVIGIWPIGALEDPEGRTLGTWSAPGPVARSLVSGLESLREGA